MLGFCMRVRPLQPLRHLCIPARLAARPLPLGRVGRTSRTLLLGSTLGFATLAPFSPLAPLFPLAPSLAGQLNCEEAQGAQPQEIANVPAPGGTSKTDSAKPFCAKNDAKDTPVGGIGRIAAAMLCWSFFAGIWFVSITMPAALMWSLATAKWKLTSALLAAYCFPHVITMPSLPQSCSHAFWHGVQGWFPELEIVHVGEPEPEPSSRERRLFCIHPHGIYTLGALTLPNHMPEIRLCIAPYLYHFAPAFRIFAELLGVKLGSTGPRDLKHLMETKNTPMAIVPGGFEEATITCRGTERVFLKTRGGFIKYALRHGYDLVPCFTVGDSDMFSNPQGAWKFRWWLNGLSIPAVLPFGFPVLPLLPKRVRVKLAIGAPLHMPQIQNPSREDVEKHRKRYLAALKATYEEAVQGTASAGRPFEVW